MFHFKIIIFLIEVDFSTFKLKTKHQNPVNVVPLWSLITITVAKKLQTISHLHLHYGLAMVVLSGAIMMINGLF